MGQCFIAYTWSDKISLTSMIFACHWWVQHSGIVPLSGKNPFRKIPHLKRLRSCFSEVLDIDMRRLYLNGVRNILEELPINSYETYLRLVLASHTTVDHLVPYLAEKPTVMVNSIKSFVEVPESEKQSRGPMRKSIRTYIRNWRMITPKKMSRSTLKFHYASLTYHVTPTYLWMGTLGWDVYFPGFLLRDAKDHGFFFFDTPLLTKSDHFKAGYGDGFLIGIEPNPGPPKTLKKDLS